MRLHRGDAIYEEDAGHEPRQSWRGRYVEDWPRLNRRGSWPRPWRIIMTYLITIRCYGTWLHGDERGSVDRDHNIPGADWVEPHLGRQLSAEKRMNSAARLFDSQCRIIVQQAIEGVAQYRNWEIHALSVRTNHVHIVVSAETTPSNLLHDFKSWATRKLREAGLVGTQEKVWARHGSTRYLNTTDNIRDAVRYVMESQGGHERRQ